MTCRIEPLHLSFASSRRLVRHFSTVVEISALPMLDAGQDRPLGGTIASQPVGYDDPRNILQPTQQLPEEALRRLGVASALDKDVEYMAVLVDGTPEVVRFTADADEYLIEVPFVSRARPAAPQRIGKRPAEAQAPVADGFVTYDDPPRRQDGLDIAETQAEAMVQPDSVLNHLSREAKASVRVALPDDGQQAAIPAPRPPS